MKSLNELESRGSLWLHDTTNVERERSFGRFSSVANRIQPIAKLESHLEECAVCREELERLAAAPQWWEGVQSYLSGEHLIEERSLDRDETKRVASILGDDTDRLGRASAIASWLPPGLLEPTSEPTRLGGSALYEVVEPIGRGGMGVVLKAFDPALNRFVALKVLASELAHNASARRRFAREAQAAAAVVHDHVVPIYSVDGGGPIPYLVMAYIPGYSLQERIDQTGPLEVREILRIGMQTAAGLAAAHAQGLVHRDIKPGNILLENGVERVRITDFGLARAMDEASQTQSGVLAGTPQYMAPEQACGETVDYRADLFSLGSVLYAMCTGHSPFRAETTVAVIRRICDGSPRPVREVNPDIPDWLAAIIAKLLSKRPNDRYGSAEEVARLLAEHLAQLQHPLRPASSLRRRIIAWSAAGAAAIAVILGGLWLADMDPQTAPQGKAGTQRVTAAKADAAPKAVLDFYTIQAELRAIDRELDRMEASDRFGTSNAPQFDELRQIDAFLEALEREVSRP